MKIKASKSKRVSSKQRHKVERKKREHKRDLRKAAKALKDKGLGASRSKKTRNVAKLALQVSNAHPDKEVILNSVLKTREDARVDKFERRKRTRDETDNENIINAETQLQRKNLLFVPTKDSNNFSVQFLRSLDELIFPPQSEEGLGELPSVAYLITLDSRFAVQCIPWSLIDAIDQRSKEYDGSRKIVLLFAFTKVDLISFSSLISQISLVGHALSKRYNFCKNVVATVAPFSTQYDRCARHILRILNQFRMSEECSSSFMKTNLSNRICTFVVGLPNTGRRSLCKVLTTGPNESSASCVPLRSAQLQVSKVDDTTEVKFVLPNAKSVTLVSLPEDAAMRRELKDASGTDILFRSHIVVEKLTEPEIVGCSLFSAIVDKQRLAQAFCQANPTTDANNNSEFAAAEKFMRNLGRTVRQEKGFHVSPLFVSVSGTMSQQNSSNLSANVTFTSNQKSSQATLLDATYSNAAPSKLIRVSSVVASGRSKKGPKPIERIDSRNILRLGARTLVREICQGGHIPWSVMRAPHGTAVTREEVNKASQIFNLELSLEKKHSISTDSTGEADHLTELISSVHSVMRESMIFLPHDVVELSSDAIVPPQYSLGNEEEDTASGNKSASDTEEE